ncbi:unnamed protein product [uncultured bacterium]|nr:unnamed protein product [uncultured bacterium]
MNEVTRHPMFFHRRPSVPIRVAQRGLGSLLETTLIFRRNVDAIHAEAGKRCDELIATHILDGADELPEVLAYKALRDKDTGLTEQIERLSLDLDQTDIDRRKAVADLDGEKLASALTKIEAKRKALTARIEDCRNGLALFTKDVAEAKGKARTALEEHLKNKRHELHVANTSQETAAAVAIQAEPRLIELLDAVSIATRAREMFLRTAEGLMSRLERVLEPDAPPSPDKVDKAG